MNEKDIWVLVIAL